METNLVFEGVKFMLLGMGTVFAFLLIMVFAMMLQAKIITRFFPEPKAAEAPAKPARTAQSSNQNAKIAAVIAAIKADRSK